MQSEYKTQIYNALGAFVLLSVMMVILIPLEFWVFASVLKLSALIGVSVVIATVALPLIFIKKIKQYYTKNAILTFDGDGFTILTNKVKGNKMEIVKNYN